VSADPGLAELLADRTRTVLLTQAATATEARLISERIAASGGAGRPPVSLGVPGDPPPAALLDQTLLDGADDLRLAAGRA